MTVFDFASYSKFKWSDMVLIFKGVGVTLEVTLISLFFGTIIGLILGLIRCAKNPVVNKLPLIVMEPLRNSPLIVQLFLVFFGLPSLGIRMKAMTAALITLSLNTAAFFAVLVHSSIMSIPKAQWEAGYALGFSKLQIYINIIAKQAIRILIPQAITLYISQLQCSSLVSFLSIKDLTKAGQIVAQKTMLPFLIYGIVAVLYFVVSYPLARFAKYLEKRTNFKI